MAKKLKVAETPEKFVSSQEYRLYSLTQTFTGFSAFKSQYEFKVGALVRLKTDITATMTVKDKHDPKYGLTRFLTIAKDACGTVIAINQRQSPLQLDKKTSFQPASEALIMFSEGDLVIDMQNVDILFDVVLPG